MFLRMLALSRSTARSTLPAVIWPSFKVKPSRTFVSTLVLELTATPLTVACALVAARVCVICVPGFDGSKASCESPAGSPLSPSESFTLMRKALASPVVVERMARRKPLASLTMDAVTPALARLMASRTLASESLPAVMLTLIAETPLLGVKLVCPAPQAPSSMVMMPGPTLSLALAQVALVLRVCAAARRLTATL